MLRPYVPLEELHDDAIGQKICQREAMLLDRCDLFPQIEVRRGGCTNTAECRRPVVRASADRARQDRSDWIRLEIERAAPQHLTQCDRVQVTADDQRLSALHRGH